MSDPAHDRLQYLLAGQVTLRWNGIDYVEIADDEQTTLRVHFLNAAPVQGTITPPITICGGETIGSVAVEPFDDATGWSADADGRPILSLTVTAPGDFSTYTLSIESTALDPYFASKAFSFKARCPSDLDCAPPPPACPSPDDESPPINYLAKDFAGFTQALSDFSALAYPAWVERSEADLGVMMMEALSAIADELSYLQDRVAAEATLGAATQRISLLRHARLVDYEPTPALAAQTLLELDVASGVTSIRPGVGCNALGADGRPIPFEIGGLVDPATHAVRTEPYRVDARWNVGAAGTPKLRPYWWDTGDRCLAAGATTLWLFGHGHGLRSGQPLLIDTAGATSADPPIRELVVIAAPPVPTRDPVFDTPLTRIDLQAGTVLDHDLENTWFAANLVPAVQGARTTETFAIPADGTPPPAGAVPVVVRIGANATASDTPLDYRHTLASDQISWIPADPQSPATDTNAHVLAYPEITLSTVDPTGPVAWQWQRWLLGSAAADTVFTVTPERYSVVGGRGGETWFDYDGEGTTIRFGDGVFGLTPDPGTVFSVTYLAGGGAVGNVPADTIVHLDPADAGAGITRVTNPFAATMGADEETAQQIRDRAPQAFQANPLRVVRPEDYVRAAETLPWVMQAGTTFRWTGSWLTVFTTADPSEREDLTIAELEELSDLLNRRRLVGYESYVLAPSYASIDLEVSVCAVATAFAGDVEAAVLAQLRPGRLPDGSRGFFDHERWSFGAPLEASALFAAIQRAAGVLGVTRICYRERGVQPKWVALPETVAVRPDRILRLDDDPSRAEDGSLKVIVQGGK